MTALNLFGVGTACIGLAGTSVAVQASRQVLALPRIGRVFSDWPVLIGLAFVVLVDVAVSAVGVCIAVIKL